VAAAIPSPPMQLPISEGLAAALGDCFADQFDSPPHRQLDEVFEDSGCIGSDPGQREPDGRLNGKAVRVRRVCTAISHGQPGDATLLVNGLLARLRAFGRFDSEAVRYMGTDKFQNLLREFRSVGWHLDLAGNISPVVVDDLPLQERRPALNLLIQRTQRAADDPALLLGSAKEMIEAACRYVLEGHGADWRQGATVEELLYLARERLELLPQQVSDESDVGKATREVYDALGKIAKHVDSLRRDEGTGHGRTNVPQTEARTARVIVQSSAVLVQLLLDTVDGQR